MADLPRLPHVNRRAMGVDRASRRLPRSVMVDISWSSWAPDVIDLRPWVCAPGIGPVPLLTSDIVSWSIGLADTITALRTGETLRVDADTAAACRCRISEAAPVTVTLAVRCSATDRAHPLVIERAPLDEVVAAASPLAEVWQWVREQVDQLDAELAQGGAL